MKKLTTFTLITLAVFLSGCAINNAVNKNTNQIGGADQQNINLNQNNDEDIKKDINKPVNVGGACQYKSIVGTAKIISIGAAPTAGNNCPQDPKIIKFEFVPNDLTAKNSYKYPNTSDIAELRINAGMNPSARWVTANNIVVGRTYVAERAEIISGACTPVVFKFSDIDLFPNTGCN